MSHSAVAATRHHLLPELPSNTMRNTQCKQQVSELLLAAWALISFTALYKQLIEMYLLYGGLNAIVTHTVGFCHL